MLPHWPFHFAGWETDVGVHWNLWDTLDLLAEVYPCNYAGLGWHCRGSYLQDCWQCAERWRQNVDNVGHTAMLGAFGSQSQILIALEKAREKLHWVCVLPGFAIMVGLILSCATG